MIMLTIIARTTPFKVWPIVRLIIIFLLAIGTGLVATLWYNAGRLDTFLSSAWVMPIITLVWVVIAILTHINGQGIKRNKDRFRRRRTGKLSHHERGVALTSRLRWGKKERGRDDRNSETYLQSPSTACSERDGKHRDCDTA